MTELPSWGDSHGASRKIGGQTSIVGWMRSTRTRSVAPEALYQAESALWLRRLRVAQFVIIYAYIPATESGRPNIVSIRAVRHESVADVFDGVRDSHSRSSIGTNSRF